jgi:hypothetical protein
VANDKTPLPPPQTHGIPTSVDGARGQDKLVGGLPDWQARNLGRTYNIPGEGPAETLGRRIGQPQRQGGK